MGCFSKYGLIIVNIFVVCLGLIVMGISAAVIHENNKFDVVLSSAYYAVPLTTLIIGIALALIGFLGCFGASRESPCMLTMYSVVVGVILLAVLTTAIMLLVFTLDATKFLTDSMTVVFNEYGDEGKDDVTHSLDDLQHDQQCCGINSYEDWVNFDYRNGTSVADGCCQNMTVGCGVGMLNNPNVTQLVWSKGCLDYVYKAFDDICYALAILCFILAGFQALSIAWACCLVRDARRFV